MYKNTIDLCRWILYPVTMLKLFINSKSHDLSPPTVDLSTHRSFFCICGRVLVCSGGMAALGCWGGDQWLPIVLSKPLWTSLFLKRGFWVSSSDNLGGFPESCRRSQAVKTSEDGASPEFQTQSVPCGSCCCRFSRISNTRGKEAWEYVKKKKKKVPRTAVLTKMQRLINTLQATARHWFPEFRKCHLDDCCQYFHCFRGQRSSPHPPGSPTSLSF